MNARRKVRSEPVCVTESSGNVFADLGVRHPERELIKAELALQIYRIIRERGLSQKQVGKILGISQPQVSVLARNRGASFSMGRLLEFLRALGQDVEISVSPARNGRGEISLRKATATTHSQECLCHRAKATPAALTDKRRRDAKNAKDRAATIEP